MDQSLTRRGLLAGAAAATLLRPKLLQAQTTGVTPVFINWNAWYDDTQFVNQQFHWQLSKAQWQFRAPWFCKILGPDRITCAGTQADMDIEIQAAANAGLKAWMWVWYGGNAAGGASAPLHAGWLKYDASAYKSTLKWSGFVYASALGNNPWSSTSAWQANCNFWVSKFQQSNYLKVGGKPVFFVGTSTSEVTTYFGGSTANMITTFNYLRSQSIAGGAGDPYIVSMGDLSGTVTASGALPWITGNAISAYVAPRNPAAIPDTAASLYAQAAAYWASNVATGNKVVPIAQLGWDTRPIIELPEFNRGYIPWITHEKYFTRGTNAEIAGHLQQCINFIGSNQPACDSKIMLAYAWNECAEGGTAGIPTLGDPPTGTPPTSNLLSAIKPVLTAAA